MRRTAYGRRGMEMENQDQTKELKPVNESSNQSVNEDDVPWAEEYGYLYTLSLG